jgi:hypothetical protein
MLICRSNHGLSTFSPARRSNTICSEYDDVDKLVGMVHLLEFLSLYLDIAVLQVRSESGAGRGGRAKVWTLGEEKTGPCSVRVSGIRTNSAIRAHPRLHWPSYICVSQTITVWNPCFGCSLRKCLVPVRVSDSNKA